MSREERTRAYVAKRTTEGRTEKEIIRCIKRYIAREVYGPDFGVPKQAPGFGASTNIVASLDRTQSSTVPRLRTKHCTEPSPTTKSSISMRRQARVK